MSYEYDINKLPTLSVFSAGDSANDGKIVAVDLQQMAPLPGVIQIQGDITKVISLIVILMMILE